MSEGDNSILIRSTRIIDKRLSTRSHSNKQDQC